MRVTITVLGSSGMFQTTERACSGYLLDVDGRHLWLDAGAGTWANLQRHIAYSDIDGVLLTHAHPDHTTDVLQAYHARRYGQEDALPNVPLWAPKETLDRLCGFANGLEEAFDLRPLTSSDEIEFGVARLSFVEMAHPEYTLGVRVDSGSSVAAFSSDTGHDADFETLARDADVFFCEATSQDSDELWEGHLRASQAGSIAAGVGVKRLLLTHLRPGRDHSVTLAEARRAAPGLDIALAQDGMRLELP